MRNNDGKSIQLKIEVYDLSNSHATTMIGRNLIWAFQLLTMIDPKEIIAIVKEDNLLVPVKTKNILQLLPSVRKKWMNRIFVESNFATFISIIHYCPFFRKIILVVLKKLDQPLQTSKQKSIRTNKQIISQNITT